LSDGILDGSVLRHANVTDANFADVGLMTVTVTYANFSKAKNVDMPFEKKNVR
jgi:uncharacterized protein YjbI with pentapeptide repeats